MATAEQIKALIKSHAQNDNEHFRAVALQIAANSAKGGNTRLAEELRALVEESRRGMSVAGSPKTIPFAKPAGELTGLLTIAYPATRLVDMVLDKSVCEQLTDVVTQFHERDRLRSFGLSPKRRLLLVGPPGCGKTMTASALANECELPLMTVQLHGLITKYMGETSTKLHLVFEAMTQTRGVYLFDEFDALGSSRNAGNDVGEIRRILNSFLQFLERDDTDSIIVAATNFEELLDQALFRRFDDLIRYALPNSTAIRKLVEARLSAFQLRNIDWKKVGVAAKNLSHAEIVRASEAAAKESVLANSREISAECLLAKLGLRKGMRLKKTRKPRPNE